MSETTQLHATCVAIGGKGVLLLGDSGSGKSELALRLIDAGALLVADDRVDIVREGDRLIAAVPPKLRGLIEARGVGIMTLPSAPEAALVLAVRLVARDAVERLPEAEFLGCLDVQLPLLSLHAFDSATDAKIRLYLQKS